MEKMKYICMKFSVLKIKFVDDAPGMSFSSGSSCPQASQTYCDTPPILRKDNPKFSFRFSLRGGGSGEGLEGEI